MYFHGSLCTFSKHCKGVLIIVRSYNSFLEVDSRLQHSTFHIMTSNHQLTYHHTHKLTRTFVWIAFFVRTEFDSDINSSSYYPRLTCPTSLTTFIYVTTPRQSSWLEKCIRPLFFKPQPCPMFMCRASLDSCSAQRCITRIQPTSSTIFSSPDQTIFDQSSLRIQRRRFLQYTNCTLMSTLRLPTISARSLSI